MKKILVLAILFISVTTFGQKRTAGAALSTQVDTTSVTKSKKYVPYVAVGLSISSGNTYDMNDNAYSFEDSSFPSVEVGVTRENLSVGAVFGRGNLTNLGQKTDEISNYYWELKVVPSFPLGVVNVNLLFGGGSYFNGKNGSTFIEYGTGITYSRGDFSYGVTYSNWDGIDYITPSLSYSFN